MFTIISLICISIAERWPSKGNKYIILDYRLLSQLSSDSCGVQSFGSLRVWKVIKELEGFERRHLLICCRVVWRSTV